MNISEAKSYLNENYIRLDFELIDEHSNEFFLARDNCRLHIDENDIATYAETSEELANFEVQPNSCSIVSQNYREQLIQPLDFYRPPFFLHPNREEIITFGKPNDQEPYIELSHPTPTYLNKFRFDENLLEWSLFYLKRKRMKDGDFIKFHDIAPRLTTIKSYNLNSTSIDKALENSDKLFYTALFELSYLRNINITDLHGIQSTLTF